MAPDTSSLNEDRDALALAKYGTERRVIALLTLRVVAEFAGKDAVAEFARRGAYRTEEAERMVADLAAEAESRSITYDGRVDDIVMRAIDRREIYDDYRRMKRGEQAMAFDFA